MRHRGTLTRKDFIVALACLVFFLASVGAVGSGGRRRAKEAVCLSNLKGWGSAYQMFLTDRDGRFQSGGWFSTCREVHSHTVWCDDHLLWPYFQNEKLLLCPEATRPEHPLEADWYQRGGKFYAAASWYDYDEITWESIPAPGKHYLISYGKNGYCTNDYSNVRGPCDGGEYGYLPTPDDGGPRAWGWVNALEVRNASYVPLVLDAAGGGTPTEVDRPPEYDGQFYYSKPMNVNEIRNFCANRHNGAVNVLFLDFSARKVGLKGLWTLKWCRAWGCPSVYPLPNEWNDPSHWMHNFKDY
jgi:prepilin-type processing-associated H-X9-DG protein